MSLTYTPELQAGTKLHDFALKSVDGNVYTQKDVAGEKGMLVMFICNHCPYVKVIISRLVEDAKVLQSKGIGVAAIMSNDTLAHPEDSFENMREFSQQNGFTFPYLIDETQEVAKKYLVEDKRTVGILVPIKNQKQNE